MPEKDKVLLMHKVEDTLKPRMFANLLEEAVDEIQDHLEEFDVQHRGDPADVKNDDLLDAYISAKRVSGLSEKTLTAYRYDLSRALNAINVKTRNITVHHIRDYLSSLRERGLSDVSIENCRQKLVTFFDWLEKEKKIQENPMNGIERVRLPKRQKQTLSNPDLALLKMNCMKPRDLAIISFLLSTGCRIGEVIPLNRQDIDFESGECRVIGKGDKERTVFLDDVTILLLKEYLASRTDDNEALFITFQKKRLLASGYRDLLKQAAARGGVENVHPHRFRRTFITRLLDRGMPIQEVAILVGHESLNTTMRYYSHSKSRIKSSYQRYFE